ncbi:MAG: cbb3-type cytochrome oxidase assembly protein CcoS [Planctomycetota bacterium]
MSIVFVMAPVALVLATVAVAAFIWAARDGQFDDTETPAQRVLFDSMDERPQDDSSRVQA